MTQTDRWIGSEWVDDQCGRSAGARLRLDQRAPDRTGVCACGPKVKVCGSWFESILNATVRPTRIRSRAGRNAIHATVPAFRQAGAVK